MKDTDVKREWLDERLADLLGKERLSYAEIARRMNVRRQYIHAVANGGSFGDGFLAKFAATFKFELPQKGASTKASTTPAPSPNEAELMRMVNGLLEDNAALRGLIDRQQVQMQTQGQLLNMLVDSVRSGLAAQKANTEDLKAIRAAIEGLPSHKSPRR